MKFTLFGLFVFCSTLLLAQRDSINVERNNLLMHRLKASKNSYVVWTKDLTTGATSKISIWRRDISIEKFNNRDVIVVKQIRSYEDSLNNKSVFTISDRSNFKTIYNRSERKRTGTEAFNYSDSEITGADSVNKNTKRNFKLSFSDFPFCFELDLETLSLLPIKKTGQKLAINFYHPGGDLPRYYPVDVLSSEEIETIKGQKIDCWKIKLSYSEDSYDVSWISKKGNELIKFEGHYKNTILTKVKLVSPISQ